MEMKLELIPAPVEDIDRAKAFYTVKLGFEADLDGRPRAGFTLTRPFLHQLFKPILLR